MRAWQPGSRPCSELDMRSAPTSGWTQTQTRTLMSNTASRICDSNSHTSFHQRHSRIGIPDSQWISAPSQSPELLRATFLEGIDLLLVSPPMLARHVPKTHREPTPVGPDVVRHIVHFILFLSETLPEGIGYLWNSSECHPASANTLTLTGQGNLFYVRHCGSRARRNTRI